MSQEKQLTTSIIFNKPPLEEPNENKGGFLSLFRQTKKSVPSESDAQNGVIEIVAETNPQIALHQQEGVIHLPVRVKQVSALNPYDDAQFEKTVEAFKKANTRLPHNMKMDYGAIAQSIGDNNRGEVIDFESRQVIRFSEIPAEEDYRSTEDALVAYQVVSDQKVISAPMPVGSTIEQQLAIMKAKQEITVVESAEYEGKAISSVVLLRSNHTLESTNRTPAMIATDMVQMAMTAEKGLSQNLNEPVSQGVLPENITSEMNLPIIQNENSNESTIQNKSSVTESNNSDQNISPFLSAKPADIIRIDQPNTLDKIAA